MLTFVGQPGDARGRPDGCGLPSAATGFLSVDVAARQVEEALLRCGDEAPPLVLLQALILASHRLLIGGVKGRAWRLLGQCVRIAYELNLHLVDAGVPRPGTDGQAARWPDKEERRRAWWAVWEMDVFASVVRRCPTAINWQQNEVLLPTEDGCWQDGRPQPSCLLETGVMARCKALRASGNQSPTAWFIVINSIMREAQAISCPRGVIDLYADRAEEPADGSAGRERETSLRLQTLAHAVRYFCMVLPAHLKHRGQRLSFACSGACQGPSGHRSTACTRHLHSAIYSIHLMSQLAALMIHKYALFRGGPASPPSRLAAVQGTDVAQQYFDSADAILQMVLASGELQYRCVNPLLANTVWLASAVQLLRREMTRLDAAEREVVVSKFEVLDMTYDQFANLWSAPKAPKKNLAALEAFLRAARDGSRDDYAVTGPVQANSCAAHRPGTVTPSSEVSRSSPRQDECAQRASVKPAGQGQEFHTELPFEDGSPVGIAGTMSISPRPTDNEYENDYAYIDPAEFDFSILDGLLSASVWS
ncbi:hypothetical protein CDD83_3692 [Cordyceps sp. RAO-2017]|nr:hypothetical protein CDD83_3692 [Cordyceps sp. RAO-2017]